MNRFFRRATLIAFFGVCLFSCVSTHAAIIGGVNLGNLTNYLFSFTDGSAGGVIDYNLQGATNGYQGDIAVNGIAAGTDLRTSGDVPWKGTMYTNAANLDSWQAIVDNNKAGGSHAPNNSAASYNEVARLSGLQADLTSAFAQINALPASIGYSGVSSTSLDGLNTQNGIAETLVINVTSGFTVNGTQIDITGDATDAYILRWDTDANFADGYEGQVKYQSGGAIVPHGGLTAGNFVHVAGDLASSGGGTTPAIPYPQGVPIDGGDSFGGGGFFTGYWLTTGDPGDFKTSNFSNAIFVGGWYTSTAQFSLTSGSSGVHVDPPVPEPATLLLAIVGLLATMCIRHGRH